VNQKLQETGCKVLLFKGDTLDTIPRAVKTLPKMDLIFIDGVNHMLKQKVIGRIQRLLCMMVQRFLSIIITFQVYKE